MNKIFRNPQIYVNSNTFQRKHISEYIKLFKSELKWDVKPGSSLLDIGCGTGDVTIDFVKPMLSDNYRQIVGTDISEESINYAKKTYGSNPRVKFEVMDIADKTLSIQEQFDHVTSFYCLNFVQDQRRAIQNIHSFLKPGGDIFLLTMAKFHVYLILDLLASNPRFKPHMLEVNSYASPYRHSQTPAEDFAEVLSETGFKDINCKANSGFVDYEEYQLENFIRMNDYLKLETTEDIRNEFIKGFLFLMRELNLIEEEGCKTIYKLPFTNFLAYAKK